MTNQVHLLTSDIRPDRFRLYVFQEFKIFLPTYCYKMVAFETAL